MPCRRRGIGERVTAANVAQVHELLQVVVEAPFPDGGDSGDVPRRGASTGDGEEDREVALESIGGMRSGSISQGITPTPNSLRRWKPRQEAASRRRANCSRRNFNCHAVTTKSSRIPRIVVGTNSFASSVSMARRGWPSEPHALPDGQAPARAAKCVTAALAPAALRPARSRPTCRRCPLGAVAWPRERRRAP